MRRLLLILFAILPLFCFGQVYQTSPPIYGADMYGNYYKFAYDGVDSTEVEENTGKWIHFLYGQERHLAWSYGNAKLSLPYIVAVDSSGNSFPILINNLQINPAKLSSTIPVNKGGTGLTNVGSNGQILISNGTSWIPTTPIWLTTESDPIWTTASSNYYTKVQSDARYLQSFTESDPVWISDSSNYYTKVGVTNKFVSLSTSYSNPSFIGSLAYSKLTGAPSLATVATSGSYTDLINKPTIPSAQVNSDWNSTSGVSQILNKPTITSSVYTNSVASTTTSGVSTASFYLTLDKTSTGTAIFPSGIIDGAPVVAINNSGVTLNYAWSYNSSTKLLTVTLTNSAPTGVISLLGLNLLAAPTAITTGTTVYLTIYGH